MGPFVGIMPTVSRPVPTPVCHFTHVEHIAMIIKHGLLSDSKAQSTGLLLTEVGHRGIKGRRRSRRSRSGPAVPSATTRRSTSRPAAR